MRTLPDLDKKNKTKENGGEAPLLQQPPPFARDNPKKADIYAPTPMMPSFGSCAIRRCERKKEFGYVVCLVCGRKEDIGVEYEQEISKFKFIGRGSIVWVINHARPKKMVWFEAVTENCLAYRGTHRDRDIRAFFAPRIEGAGREWGPGWWAAATASEEGERKRIRATRQAGSLAIESLAVHSMTHRLRRSLG